MHPALSGFAWRRKAGALIAGKLDEIFPGHGISRRRHRRRSLHRAPPDGGGGPGLHRDGGAAEARHPRRAHLLARLQRRRPAPGIRPPSRGRRGRLHPHLPSPGREFLGTADRVVVMRDGRVVDARPAGEFTRNSLVAAMGSVAKEEALGAAFASKRQSGSPRVRARPAGQSEGPELIAFRGEVVGLGGPQRPWPDRSPRPARDRGLAEIGPLSGRGAGGAHRRRPTDRRHLPALVHRQEHLDPRRSAPCPAAASSIWDARPRSPPIGAGASTSARRT